MYICGSRMFRILNHDCHFYCLDFDETKDADKYLRLSGVKYVISTKFQTSGDNSKQTKKNLNIFNNIYYLDSRVNENYIENVKLCYTIATSGSTGAPKMVHVPFECIEPNITSLSCLLNVQQNDVIFLGSPPSFDPFVVELFLALKTGASVLITSKQIRLQPQQLLKVMFPGVSIFQTTPSLFRLFGKQSIHDEILVNKSSLRCLILGGEDFPAALELQTWLPLDFSNSGKRIFNIYGITEVSCWSSIYEFNNQAETKDCGIPLGKPLDDYTFLRLLDEYGNIMQHTNCKGELEIGSSTRFCFIPQLDGDDVKIMQLKDVIYRKTGDLVQRDASGNLFYLGRTNNTVKRLGKRLCLDSLSKKVEHLLSNKNVCYKVISLWHRESSKLIFYLVNSNKVPLEERYIILDNFKQNLDNHEQPDKVLYGNELPLNCHGKVDRKKILNEIFVKKIGSSAVKIFQDFLTNVMGFQLTDQEDTKAKDETCVKRLKLYRNVSFLQAGGTSFQALSLATEIADLMEHNDDKRRILEMLLDNSTTIEEILNFLTITTKKLENSHESNEKCEGLENYTTSFKQLWRCNLKKCIDATPSLYQDKVVAVGSHSHLLLTLNNQSGEEISRVELNDRIECSVVFVTSQLALVGCYDGYLYGFDFNNGSISWKLNVKGMIKAKPLVIKNMVIVASYADQNNIMAFDLRSLSPIWSLKLGSKGIFSSPLQIMDHSVLFCTLDGTYALIEAEIGSIKWLQKLESPVFSTPAKLQTSHESFIILAEVRGSIFICKAENGEKICAFQTEGNVFSGVTLHQPHNANYSFIIFGCHDKNVYCLKFAHNTKELTLHWQVPLNAAVFSTPIVISQQYILACSTLGLMVLIDLIKGEILASYHLQAEVFSSPCCLKDKYVYVGSRDNYLYAFELEK
ncbi:beta-alanine-activating enzyme isoform X2 [Lucilia sericata]|uniref:beta-alanine-activating enzyme isoform X2 n=1 Tax=Lucilia sericata TaxID=13632 RepID=UPI0018A7F596|nr:beta-alanine-activating enzyme isoform X2 [Lucilia sericata]